MKKLAMGWITDGAYDHKRWVALVLDDGRVTGSTTGGGVVIGEPTPADLAAGYEMREYPIGGPNVVIPWERVALWQVACECGWSGSERPAVTETQHGTRHCPEDLEAEWAGPEWSAHVAPFAALHDLEQLIDQQRDLEAGIADKVHLARTGGASWTQVGRAAGLTKQGAQQRWGQL